MGVVLSTYMKSYLDVEPGRILADCPPPSPMVTRSTQLTGLRTPWSPILALVTMLLVFCDTQSATLSVSRNLSAALRWAKSYEKCNSKIRKEPRTELLAESALPQIDRGKNQRGLKSFPFRVIIQGYFQVSPKCGDQQHFNYLWV